MGNSSCIHSKGLPSQRHFIHNPLPVLRGGEGGRYCEQLIGACNYHKF